VGEHIYVCVVARVLLVFVWDLVDMFAILEKVTVMDYLHTCI